MTKKPKIIIGAETEYGIVVKRKTERGNLLSDSLAMALDIVNAALNLDLRVFKRSLEGIADMEEHSAVEIADIVENEAINASEGAIRQRRGLTGHVLENGARFYVDMGHPEYSIPETTNPLDALIAQKAGDRITELCRAMAQKRWAAKGFDIRLDKNNSDGRGNSYAAHENYLLSRPLFESLVGEMETDERNIVTNFFVSRQIITGAGKVGSESGRSVPYQITQRADFIENHLSMDTTNKRGIINMRDHSYAGDDVARLHVINGDGNLSELSLFLKFGTAGLVFMMLESGFFERGAGNLALPLKNPVRSYRNVSRDLTMRHEVHFAGSVKRTALQIQQQFCDMAKSFVSEYELGSVWSDVVKKWEGALEGLESENRARREFSRDLDWVVKEEVINRYMEKNRVEPLHDYCKMINLEYHNTDPQKSIYEKLVRQERIERMITDEQIKQAVTDPPEDTRAWLRGEVMRRYMPNIMIVSWGAISFTNYSKIFMKDPFRGSRDEMKPLLEGDPGVEEFLSRIRRAEIEGLVVVSKDDWRL